MLYFSLNKVAFYDSVIHESMPSDAVEITSEQHQQLLKAINAGCIIHDDLTFSPPKPTPYHTWNGTEWVMDEAKKAELKALNQQKYINDIDAKAEAIYNNWTRFESEYKARKEAAEAYKAANYQGEASRYITSFAIPAGISNQVATDLILTQAAGLQKLQDELAAQRMRKYELKRPDLSDEQMQEIYKDIIQQMDSLEEAYNNG